MLNNGERRLQIISVAAPDAKGVSLAEGTYVWTGPGPLNEPIKGTINRDHFSGGGTVWLELDLKSGNLVGTAERRNTASILPAELRPCK